MMHTLEQQHPVVSAGQQIVKIVVSDTTGLGHSDRYAVGERGVTRIEATWKDGLHSHLPYVRVWNGEKAIAEFCQHLLAGVYFD